MFFSAGPMAAEYRAPFESSYSLSDINEAEAEVSVQLAVSVTNHSGGEVHYGVLRILRDAVSDEPSEPYARFEQISLPLAGVVHLSTHLILTTEEYEAWSGGQALPAEIECIDENGVEQAASIHLRYSESQLDE